MSKADNITVVAQCRVEHAGRTHTVRSFDSAWHLAWKLATEEGTPVGIRFDKFVRIEP